MLVRMASSKTKKWKKTNEPKKQRNDKCCHSCEEKGTLLDCWWACKLVSTMENAMEDPQKVNNRTGT